MKRSLNVFVLFCLFALLTIFPLGGCLFCGGTECGNSATGQGPDGIPPPPDDPNQPAANPDNENPQGPGRPKPLKDPETGVPSPLIPWGVETPHEVDLEAYE